MSASDYIKTISQRFKSGISTEHSYRGDLQILLEQLIPKNISVTNEPTRIECGAPDYILAKGKIPVGYIEAKDIGSDLDNKAYKEQFDRYKKSLPNLVITNYLEFRFYKDGSLVNAVTIGKVIDKKVLPETDNFEKFTDLITDFASYIGLTIKSASKLSIIMAGKARLLANAIENALSMDNKEKANSVYESANNTLQDQLNAFKEILIHDITIKEFSDIYAQTITYGMFAARLHDPTLDDFSRYEAAELIPKTNPFLRKLFQYIAGYDLDDRIKWIVDALADIFRATNVAELLEDFGKTTQQNDPIIHFYETFLSEYDPKLRKSRGVWYTPEPVVNFIVRAVDDILKSEFGLKEGLADTSKTKVKTKVPNNKYKSGYAEMEQEVHKVQILDPAAGTGTFLAEIVKQIHNTFQGQQGIWSQYVEDHLIPRLNGFEILMASYAMAHLKLDMLLAETGFKPKRDQRFRIFLTNSLEEHHPDTGTLFASWLSAEANEANHIKRDTPVMVVLGNPPYSVSSSNKSEWIEKLMADYKKDLNERNIQPLSDDYIKFIRFAQYFIDKNGEGVLAYISNNSFIDGLIHRQMRKKLSESFDKIYILDLHGNYMKKEKTPEGSKDENVFDIMQGVSINLFIKNNQKRKNKIAKVLNFDLHGLRQHKYDYLIGNSLNSVPFNNVNCSAPKHFFVIKSEIGLGDYNSGFSIKCLFHSSSTGVETGNDKEFVRFNSSDFTSESFLSSYVEQIYYRPFDLRYCYYNNDILRRAAYKNLKHLRSSLCNIGIVFPRQVTTETWSHIQVINCLFDNRGHYSNKGRSLVIPLYTYREKTGLLDQDFRSHNLKNEIIKLIDEKLGLPFTQEKEETNSTFAPIDLLDYIYAVLHSPTYRKKYKEFLKIDFPRVPYPEDKKIFWKLVKLGGELRGLHLLESPKVEQFITAYPEDGDNTVTRKIVKKDFEIIDEKEEIGRIWINDTQYFDNVPVVSWEFYIGGYQPAQKWLKDRKGRQLSYEDIRHYQKIIVALAETGRIMKEIDSVVEF